MRYFGPLLLAGACLLALSPAPSRGGWGGGGCSMPPAMGPVGPAFPFQPPPMPPVAAPVQLTWYLWPDDASQAALLANGVQVGGYDFKTGRYRTLDGPTGRWGPEGDLPPGVSPPALPEPVTEARKGCPCTKGERCTCGRGCGCGPHAGGPATGVSEKAAGPCFGVESDRVHPGRHYLDGEEIGRGRLMDILADGVPDDKAKLRVTVIGPEAERAAVVSSLGSHPARDKFLLQSYPSDSWAVACGFKTDGRPSVYMQAPDGKVLWRQADGNPADLARGLDAALRVTDPNYHPDRDPGPHQPAPAPIPGPAPGPGGPPEPILWGGLGLLAVLALRRPK